MSEDINSVVVVGRLTRDAEMKYTSGGTAICKFSVANNKTVKKGDQWSEEANFFDVVLWGKRGEAIAKYLGKGKQVAISGELDQQRWEKDGQKRSRIEIKAHNVQLLGGQKGGGQGPENFEDDIPF